MMNRRETNFGAMSARILLQLLTGTVAIYAGAQSVSAETLTLAADGKTQYTILHASDASATERFAAKELGVMLQRATGASFPITAEAGGLKGPFIIVGPTELGRSLLSDATVKPLGDEEFLIKTVGHNLLITGDRPLGSLWGVYSFLEQEVGWRWLTVYGDEVVPHKPMLTVESIDRRDHPTFKVRDYFMMFGWHKSKLKSDQFLYRNRTMGARLLVEYKQDKMEFMPDLATSYPYRYLNGFGHTFFTLVNPDRYFKDHPEYFSMIKGVREPRQLCFSSHEMCEVMTREIENIIQKNTIKTGTMIHLGAQDEWTTWCECPDCTALAEKEGTPAASLYKYMVELAAKLKVEHPGVYISTLAYRKSQSEPPPATIEFPDNILITFAPIDSNFTAPLDAPLNADTARNLEIWSRKVRHLWIWYYPNPYGDRVFPIGNFRKLSRDMKFFHRLGVEGIFMENDGPVSESLLFSDLQTWVLAKLMWNPEQDIDALITQYTDVYYGSAAPDMRQYINLLEDVTGKVDTEFIWNPWQPDAYTYLTPPVILDGQKILQTARDKVTGDEARTLRINQVAMSLDRATLYFWPQLKKLPQLTTDWSTVERRYKDTWRQTVIQRFQSPSDEIIKSADDWVAKLTDRKE